MRKRGCKTCRWQYWEDRPRNSDPCDGCRYESTSPKWKRRKLWQIMRAIDKFFEKRRRARK